MKLVSPYHVLSPAVEFNGERMSFDYFGCDRTLWYIYQALGTKGTTVYFSSVSRQKADYGCETFSIKDAVAFLRNPHFF